VRVLIIIPPSRIEREEVSERGGRGRESSRGFRGLWGEVGGELGESTGWSRGGPESDQQLPERLE